MIPRASCFGAAGLHTSILPGAEIVRHLQVLCGVAMAMGFTTAASAADEVTAVVGPGQVGIRVNGEPFAVYNHGAGLAKPYIYPLRAPGGHVVTTVAPFDHKHHKGVWVGVEEVNGINFWGGKYQQQDAVDPAPASERIETEHVDIKPAANGALTLSVHNLWQGEGGKTVAHEKTNITVYPNRLMVYDITLTAADTAVSFKDTKEGYLAIRVAPSMNEKTTVRIKDADSKRAAESALQQVAGRIVNADGEVGEASCWGKTSDWVDYSGLVDGNLVGVSLFDHPGNFRKSRYHVRAYGLFAISPFGEKVYSKGQSDAPPISLQPGQSLSVKYGLFPHQGDEKTGKVAEAYAKFVEWTK
jgi:hypothetical protein